MIMKMKETVNVDIKMLGSDEITGCYHLFFPLFVHFLVNNTTDIIKTKKYEWIFMKISRNVQNGKSNRWVNFNDDPEK